MQLKYYRIYSIYIYTIRPIHRHIYVIIFAVSFGELTLLRNSVGNYIIYIPQGCGAEGKVFDKYKRTIKGSYRASVAHNPGQDQKRVPRLLNARVTVTESALALLAYINNYLILRTSHNGTPAVSKSDSKTVIK